jgi:hypothetical protein
VRARILLALSAWLLGAVTATGGCLMAVSLLGNSFGAGGSPSQQLTIAAVHQALAAARHAGSPPPPAAPSRAAQPRARRHTPAARPSSTPTPAQPAAGAGTVLTSPGGSVVAVCESAGAYLLSWSPAQGYGVDWVDRGPAAVARVVFDMGTQEMTMHVTCPGGGTPTSTTSSVADGGGGGEPGGGEPGH